MLSALALRSKAYWGYSDGFMAACRDELTYTAEQIRSKRFTFTVAERDGTCLGFYAPLRLTPEKAELEALFVEPRSIGMGFGKLLLRHAVRQAVRKGAVSLVVQGDPHTDGFYRAAGGVPVGRRESGSIPDRYLPVFEIDLVGIDN